MATRLGSRDARRKKKGSKKEKETVRKGEKETEEEEYEHFYKSHIHLKKCLLLQYWIEVQKYLKESEGFMEWKVPKTASHFKFVI